MMPLNRGRHRDDGSLAGVQLPDVGFAHVDVHFHVLEAGGDGEERGRLQRGGIRLAHADIQVGLRRCDVGLQLVFVGQHFLEVGARLGDFARVGCGLGLLHAECGVCLVGCRF
jgi:hypothetical protein